MAQSEWVSAMTRWVIFGALLLATPAAAQWQGHIVGKPVLCDAMPGALVAAPTGGDAAVVTAVGLWCHGAPWRLVEAQVYVADRVGTLAFQGYVCKRGPHLGHRKQRARHCCSLGHGTFTGNFQPLYPPDENTGPVFLVTGTLTSFAMDAACRHTTLPGAVDLRSLVLLGTTTTSTTTTSTTEFRECQPPDVIGAACTTSTTLRP
jgi:hypothetical protein